jgi:hypothetical protein
MVKRRAETEAQRQARYAARDVTDKLGIKEGDAVRVVGYADADLVARVEVKTGRAPVRASAKAKVILYWPRVSDEVTPALLKLKNDMVPEGGIWVISAKKGGQPYLPDKILIPLGLAAGLVDNKICSISDAQTAMRFVIRRRDRQQV